MDQQVSSDGFLRKSLSNVVQMGLRMPIGFMWGYIYPHFDGCLWYVTTQ